MYPFGGIPLAPILAGYLASVLCRMSLKRGKRPRWLIAGFCTLLGTFSALFATFRSELFRPERWDRGKHDLWIDFLIAGVPSAVLAAVAAFEFVRLYQKDYEHSNRVS